MLGFLNKFKVMLFGISNIYAKFWIFVIYFLNIFSKIISQILMAHLEWIKTFHALSRNFFFFFFDNDAIFIFLSLFSQLKMNKWTRQKMSKGIINIQKTCLMVEGLLFFKEWCYDRPKFNNICWNSSFKNKIYSYKRSEATGL